MFVAVGPSGHFSIVSLSACALSNKGSWFPRFIFFELFLGALEVRISQLALLLVLVSYCVGIAVQYRDPCRLFGMTISARLAVSWL